MEVQAALGSEIVMAFDECPPGDAGHERTRTSLELTQRWAARSKEKFVELQDTGMDMGYLSEPGAVATGAVSTLGSDSAREEKSPGGTAPGSD